MTSRGPTDLPVSIPRRIRAVPPDEFPVDCWVILVDVTGALHVTHIWGVDEDPHQTVILFSTKSTEYDDDEDADWMDFVLAEVYATKDAAHMRAKALGDAYEVCSHVYSSRYDDDAADLVLQEWRRRYMGIWRHR